jgi:hypothetical protein
MATTDALKTFWTMTPEALCAALSCTRDGLNSQEAATRH